jgi:hypothetical protein
MYLSDIRYSWPFIPNAPQNLEDKEIFSHWIEQEDACATLRISIPSPLDGYTYLAFRFVPFNEVIENATFELVHGMTNKPVFKWIQPAKLTDDWNPFPFPLIHPIIALTEDGIDLVLKLEKPMWGKVEMIAFELEDLPSVPGLSYCFVNSIVNKITMLLTSDNVLMMPFLGRWTPKVKLLPPLPRVLDTFRAEWCDRAVSWNGVDLKRPF